MKLFDPTEPVNPDAQPASVPAPEPIVEPAVPSPAPMSDLAPSPMFDSSPAPMADLEVAVDELRFQKADFTRSFLTDLFQSMQRSPDQQAEIVSVARRTRIDPDIVEKELPFWKSTLDAAAWDPQRVMDEQPGMVDVLMGNPGVGQVALHDQALRNALTDLRDQARQRLGQRRRQSERPDLPPEFRPGALDEGAKQLQKEWDQAIEAHDLLRREEEVPAKVAKATAPLDPAASLGPADKVTGKLGWNEEDGIHVVTPGVLQRAYQQGDRANVRADLAEQWMDAYRSGDPARSWEARKRLLAYDLQGGPVSFGDDTYSTILSDVGGILPSHVTTLGQGLMVGGVAAVTAGGLSVATGGAFLPVAALGLKLGAMGGAFLASYRLEQGNALADYLGMEDDAGAPIDPEVAIGASRLYGALAAFVETGTDFGPGLRLLGPAGRVLSLSEKRAFINGLLKNPAERKFHDILRAAGREWLAGAAAEGGEEFVQGRLQDALGYLAQSMSASQGQEWQWQELSEKDIDRSLQRGAEEFRSAAVGAGVLGAKGFHGNVRYEQKLMRAALADQEAVRQIDQAQTVAKGAESPTAKADGSVYQAIVERDTQRYGAQPMRSLWLDPRVFRLAQGPTDTQDEPVLPGQVSPAMENLAKETLGEGGDQKLRDAVASGQKIEVSLADYAERIAGRPLGEAALAHITTVSNGQTQVELRADLRDREERAKEIVAQIEADKVPLQPEEGPFAKLEDSLLLKFTPEEARSVVKVWRKFANSLSVRMKLPLAQVVNDTVARIEASFQEQGIVLPMSPEASQHLANAWRTMSVEDRRAAVFLDSGTKFGNARAFETLAHDQFRPFVAQVSVPGLKWLNEGRNHDLGNLLLRTVSNLLARHDATAAKIGGDFAIRVRDQQHLDDILKEVNAALPANLKAFQATGAMVRSSPGAGGQLEAFHRAADKHREWKDAERLAGRRSARTAAPMGLEGADPTKLVFPDEKPLGIPAIPKEIVAAFESMSEVGQIEAAYVRDGALTNEGWQKLQEVAEKTFKLSMDVRWVHELQARIGRENTDTILSLIVRMIVARGGSLMDFARLHGDELAAQANDEQTLRTFAALVERVVKTIQFETKATDGRRVIVDQVKVAFEVDPSFEEADRKVGDVKKAQDKKGVQSARIRYVEGDRPGGVGEGARGDRQREGADRGRGAPGHGEPAGLLRSGLPRGIPAQGFAAYDGSLGQGGALAEVATFSVDALFWSAVRDDAAANIATLAQGGDPKEAEVEQARFREASRRLGLDTDVPRLAQEGEGTPRGFVEFVQDGLKRIFRIFLAKDANISTLLHESGHVMLEIFLDMAERQVKAPRLPVPQGVLDDYARALKFLGVESRAELTGRLEEARRIQRDAGGTLSKEQKAAIADLTAPYEKWARSFEAYFMEGRAPSHDLAGLFRRMQLWLKGIYKTIDRLRAPLNDEIRGVFDRLLATDEEIRSVAERMAVKPIWRSPEHAGMTPEEWREHLKKMTDATSHAEVAAELRARKEQLSATDRHLREESAKARQEAEAAYAELPAARAFRFLRLGDAGGNAILQGLVDDARRQEMKAGRISVESIAEKEKAQLVRVQRKLAKLGGGKTHELVMRVARDEQGVVQASTDATAPGVFRQVAVPAWLSAEEYVANRQAWDLTWLAMESGTRADEGQQRLVHFVMRKAFSDTSFAFGENEGKGGVRAEFNPEARRWVHFGWVAAKLLAGSGGKSGAVMRDKLRELATHPEATWPDDLGVDWDRFAAFLRRQKKRARHMARETYQQVATDDHTGGWLTAASYTLGLNLRGGAWELAPREGTPLPKWYSAEVTDEVAGMARIADRSESERQVEELMKERAILERAIEAAALGASRGKPKLNAEAVAAAAGHETGRTFRGLLAPDGLDPDQLAEVLQAGTGAALVQDMVKLPAKSIWAAARGDQIMAERWGDTLDERARLNDLITKEMHSDATLHWLLHELAVLGQKMGERTSRVMQRIGAGSGGIPYESVKRAAEMLVEKSGIDRIDAGRFLADEQRFSEAAVLAAAKDDYEQAYIMRHRQILAYLQHRFALEAREMRTDFLQLSKELGKRDWRARAGKASPAIRDGIDRLLVALGLHEPFPRYTPAATFQDAVVALERSGTTVLFDDTAIGALIETPPAPPPGLNKLPWQSLTVAQARAVYEALQNLRAGALAQEEVIRAGKKADKDATILLLEQEAKEELPKLPLLPAGVAGSWWHRMKGRGRQFDADIVQIERFIRWLGGGREDSAWMEAILDPIQKAKHREADLLKEHVAPIIEAFDAMPPEVRRRMREKVDGAALFPDHTDKTLPPMWRYEILMAALNAGNEENLLRLTVGRNITRAQLFKALEMLTPAELHWVQTVWDSFEGFWPLALALEVRKSGLEPKKVMARPFTVNTKDGPVHMRGGYMPAVYDRGASMVGERQAAESVMDFIDPKFTPPFTAHGYLKARARNYTDVILLDPTVLPAHISQVAHDIAFREAVQSVGSLLIDERVRAVMRERLGDERRDAFIQWLKDIGNSRASQVIPHAKALNRFFREVRANMAPAILGYAADIAIGDLTNVVVALAADKVGTSYLTKAIGDCMPGENGWTELRKEGLRLSGELRFRSDHVLQIWDNMMRRGDFTRARFPGSTVYRAYVDNAFVFFEGVDAMTATPIWWAAFRQAMSTEKDGLGMGSDMAIRHADGVIRGLFPPQRSVVDASSLMRDKGFAGSMMLFFGYLNTIFGLRREQAHRVYVESKREGSTALTVLDVAARAGFRVLAIAVAYNVLGELLTGRGREPDEDWAEWFARKLLMGALFNDLPWGALVEPIATRAIQGTAKRSSVRAAPGLAVIQSFYQAADNAAGDPANVTKIAHEAARALALTFGVPVRPLRSADFLWDVVGDYAAERESRLHSPYLPDLASGIIYGGREDKGDDPFSLTQDAIDWGRNKVEGRQ